MKRAIQLIVTAFTLGAALLFSSVVWADDYRFRVVGNSAAIAGQEAIVETDTLECNEIISKLPANMKWSGMGGVDWCSDNTGREHLIPGYTSALSIAGQAYVYNVYWQANLPERVAGVVGGVVLRRVFTS